MSEDPRRVRVRCVLGHSWRATVIRETVLSDAKTGQPLRDKLEVTPDKCPTCHAAWIIAGGTEKP